jgi:hypothetical protein
MPPELAGSKLEMTTLATFCSDMTEVALPGLALGVWACRCEARVLRYRLRKITFSLR